MLISGSYSGLNEANLSRTAALHKSRSMVGCTDCHRLRVVVIPGKLEHVFNDYVLVILAGIISIVLGYLLFKTGIVEAGNTQFKVENTAYKFILSGQAPGLFFMFFGVAILIFYLWTMRPQKEIVAVPV